MLYRVYLNGFEEKVFNFAIQKSKFLSICTFKHTKINTSTEKYKLFFSLMDPFKYEPTKIEFAPYQHYRSGQKFVYFNIESNNVPILESNTGFSCWNYPDLPEDIAFYNGKMAWLYYISHENLLYLRTENRDLIEALKSLGCELVVQS